ncbi:MAG: hypothetical protein K8J08_10125 [Thermoanaerobaculia bacterium]|nr:hypothetical protein [Thermoanaerobaculia bacterium]
MTQRTSLITLATLTALILTAPAWSQDDEGRYGFFSVVEGSATVTQNGERSEVEQNYPLMTGDKLFTSYESRVEAVLPDSTVLRLGGNGVLDFSQLAYSGDASGDSLGTQLYLDKGELVLTVPQDTVGAAQTRVDTPNATVYLVEPGTYVVESKGYVTSVVVRSGSVDLLTRDESIVVSEREEARVTGINSPRVELVYARSASRLEQWSDQLDRLAGGSGSSQYVDRTLSYSSASLSRSGNWYTESSQTFWRPRVSVDWAPYRSGRWVYTPSGTTWVSSEPWGWVPHHYGSWDYHNSYGWVWYPGRIYRPAWVYWYWGSDRVGWCPTGYYTRYYGRRHYGSSYASINFRIGVHGWAGGHVRDYDRWSFVDSNRVYDRHLRNQIRDGRHTRDHYRSDVVPRGLITTDTRGLRPDAVRQQPRAAIEILQRRGEGHDSNQRIASRRDLPDVSDFVARRDSTSRETLREAMPVSDRSDRPSRSDATDRPNRSDRSDRSDRSASARRDGEGVRSVTSSRDGGVQATRGERPTSSVGSRSDDTGRREVRADSEAPSRTRTTLSTAPRDSGEDRSRTVERREVKPSGERSDSRSPRATTGGPSRTVGSRGESSTDRTVRTVRPSAEDSRGREVKPRDQGRATTTPRTPTRDREIVRRVVEGSRPRTEGNRSTEAQRPVTREPRSNPAVESRGADRTPDRRVTTPRTSSPRETTPRTTAPRTTPRTTERSTPRGTDRGTVRGTERGTDRGTRTTPTRAPAERTTTRSPEPRSSTPSSETRSGSSSSERKSTARSSSSRRSRSKESTSSKERSGSESSDRKSRSRRPN